MSHQGRYGPADLGRDGIRSFFARHSCNRFCESEWTQPRSTGDPLFPMRQGTSMARRLPTRHSRNPLTRLEEDEEDEDED